MLNSLDKILSMLVDRTIYGTYDENDCHKCHLSLAIAMYYADSEKNPIKRVE